ncbi:SsrA-binding protein SmpB [Candidatus Peregrinibacteria bacterium]|jgi:SsrA-binding protein|nr:SsrA-binding protein SmpB [Candidatus Peregrinibacteria bacterium]
MILNKNKKAYFDYEILKEYTAGIILSGGEVRSCRNKSINLKGAYISIKDKFIILRGASISRYKFDQTKDYDPLKNRLLLIRAKEIHKIESELNTSGVSLIPLQLFTQGRLIKLKIGLARGKKQYDKRETIKKRDIERRKT